MRCYANCRGHFQRRNLMRPLIPDFYFQQANLTRPSTTPKLQMSSPFTESGRVWRRSLSES